jgi:hypothetical protein
MCEMIEQKLYHLLRVTLILCDKDVCNNSSIVLREKITIRRGQQAWISQYNIQHGGRKQTERVMNIVKGRRKKGDG